MKNAIIVTGTEVMVGLIGDLSLVEMMLELKNEGEKIYPDSLCVIQDQGLFETVASLSNIGDTVGVNHPLYKTILKNATDYVRCNTGANCVISLALDVQTGSVLAYEYESIKATESNFYNSGYDNYLNVPYLILK
ncbi:hypothetical protein [Viridibacillus arvi]|uniref:hypothetical protein n=1 Tax=Viridibacillus arvi TaxID=263475 RepID=UPI0034CD52D0